MFVRKSKSVVLAATGQPLHSLSVAELDAYTVFYHETQGNMVVGKGQVFAWLYSNPEARYHLSTGRYDLVFFPPGRSTAMAFSGGGLLDAAWKANKRRGHGELMALVDGWLIEEQGVPTLLIRRMSVRKCYRRNGLNTQLIKVLHSNFPNHALAFEDLTQEGYEFARRAFPEAGHVWTEGTRWRPKGYEQPAVQALAA